MRGQGGNPGTNSVCEVTVKLARESFNRHCSSQNRVPTRGVGFKPVLGSELTIFVGCSKTLGDFLPKFIPP